MSLKETCVVLLRSFLSHVFQLTLLKIFFIVLCSIISQGCPFGLAVEPICIHMSQISISNLKSQISNLYFNTVKIHQVFCYIIMKYKLHNNI